MSTAEKSFIMLSVVMDVNYRSRRFMDGLDLSGEEIMLMIESIESG
jgi:hypothetical protein